MSIPGLPILSPNIEQTFAKLKAQLRKHAERSMESLWTRIGALLDSLSPAECQNVFCHPGFEEFKSGNALIAAEAGHGLA